MDLPGLRGLRPALAALAAAAGVLLAGGAPAQPVAARDAWVRAPAPGQKVAGAYLELVAQSRSALIAAASPVSARAELHRTVMAGGVMRMRPVDRIELAPGATVKLEPGGLHLMLVDLRRPLAPGEHVPITFTVELADRRRTTFTVQAEVRAAAAPHHGH